MYGWIIHRIWGRWTEFGVAGVGKWMGGWAGIGTKVQRWMVIGIKGLWAQSDRMLSIGDGQTHIRVLKVLSKKGKNARSLDRIVRQVDRWSPELPELADR